MIAKAFIKELIKINLYFTIKFTFPEESFMKQTLLIILKHYQLIKSPS